MAFTSILRRSASSLAPLATRLAVGGQRSYHAAIVTAANHFTHSHKASLTPFVPTPHRFYSKQSSDQSLLRVIESEIQCAEETDDLDKDEEIPFGFPFKIEDTPGIQTVTLKRTYHGEDIQVEVHMPDLVTGEEDDDQDNDDDSENASKSSIPLLITVSKTGAPSLEFSCTAFPDEIQIDSLAVKNPADSEDQIAYEGPDFHDLDENLQKAFHKYLEIRGIKPATTNFLHEYMLNKDSKEYANWLQKLKKFVEA